jgi:hypothetical protein
MILAFGFIKSFLHTTLILGSRICKRSITRLFDGGTINTQTRFWIFSRTWSAPELLFPCWLLYQGPIRINIAAWCSVITSRQIQRIPASHRFWMWDSKLFSAYKEIIDTVSFPLSAGFRVVIEPNNRNYCLGIIKQRFSRLFLCRHPMDH